VSRGAQNILLWIAAPATPAGVSVINDLQLAVIRAAWEVFIAGSLPGTAATPAPSPSCGRWPRGSWVTLRTGYSPGGCFLVSAAEFGSRPGPVRQAAAAAQRDWANLLQTAANPARGAGELSAITDPG
jgi:hypothetical protein